MKVNFTFSAEVDVSQDFREYDRLCLGDSIGKEIRRVINSRKDCKLIEFSGSIVVDRENIALKGIKETQGQPFDIAEYLRG